MWTFNKWYKENHGEIPMDKNSKPPQRPPLQFTKLTTDDIHKHRRVYGMLLMDDRRLTLGERGIEMMKAEQLFREAFQ